MARRVGAFACPILLSAQVLTSQYDNARTSSILTETQLTPANVNSRQFGKRFSLPVDGDVYAQPLYVPNVPIPGKGTHGVLFVATEHNTVYAFDAAGQPSTPLWKVNFNHPDQGVTPVPSFDHGCTFIHPEIGITPTPAIDLPSGTLYVLARTKENAGLLHSSRYVQKLHALAITTGVEKFGGPVEIKAPGFDALHELPRAGLLLTRGSVVLTWGSSCDVKPYTGWVMAYDGQSLVQKAVFNAAPDAGESGIWQSDRAPAADEQGNIYLATGNGKFTIPKGGRDYGDSLLKLDPSLKLLDFFTPYNEARLNAEDDDLGAGAPIVLPRQGGPHPDLVLIGGKGGTLYSIDRDRMGKFTAEGDAVVQRIDFRGGIYAAPAYWNGHVFVLAAGDYLTDLALDNGQLTKTRKMGGQRFGNPGGTPVVSSNGKKDGIVWIIQTKAFNAADRPAMLHAYDAADVARELYDSNATADRDAAGMTLRFTIPTVANGRVYVPAKRLINVYGLLK